ncbi:retention module-containing protein, partial [Alcaligenaceae bacterium]|nr:retention module-containing protein [Alcaligenaceae bacterium]
MATDTALVIEVIGQAWLRGADGSLTPVTLGMRIPVGSEIITADGNEVHLEVSGMPPIIIGPNREFTLSLDVVRPDVDPTESAVTPPPDQDVLQLIQALNSNADPFSQLDSTSSTLETGGGHGVSGFTRLLSIAERTLEDSSLLSMSGRVASGPESSTGGAQSQSEQASNFDGTAPPLAPGGVDLAPLNAVAQVTNSVGSAREDVNVAGGMLQAAGRVSIFDADAGQGAFNPATLAQAGSTFLDATGQAVYFGSIDVSSDGTYTYRVSNDAVQFLGADQSITERYTIASVDGSATSTISITIYGSNDVPVITGVTSGQVTEDLVTLVGGRLLITDPDAGQSRFVGSTRVGEYGVFRVDAEGNWTYTLTNGRTSVQQLGEGQSAEEIFTIRSADGTESQVAITIHGTNDAATITGDKSALVQEDAIGSVAGNLHVSDIDLGESSFQAGVHVGGYGKLSLDVEGNWLYTLNNEDGAVQALGAADTITDRITVFSADGTPSVITITIQGTNDAAVITGAVAGSVQEDLNQVTSGKLDITDADHGQAIFQSDIIVGSYGVFVLQTTGNWTYTLSNDRTSVQQLKGGQTAEEIFTVKAADGTTSQVAITIHGTNDAASITGTKSGQVQEDHIGLASGKLHAIDTDLGESSFQAGEHSGSYGALTIDAAGNWTYTLANDQPNVQALGYDATATDYITVKSVDGTESVIEVTIHGTNDAAQIGGVKVGTVTEDGTQTATGTLTINDADADQSSFVATDYAGTYGALTIDAAGNWTYTLANDQPNVQALGYDATATDYITVKSVD